MTGHHRQNVSTVFESCSTVYTGTIYFCNIAAFFRMHITVVKLHFITATGYYHTYCQKR